ncbi:hypothetical protein E2C01_048558 [Portunus trituberculatus]|uniref:Uncharacterized protein n=1 Tax=Portunus trituberculatus TaxID=210409 RepID=A0A5B7GDR6_PORTR|nr:hypothetical protein [Portunus trituberculatus]
MGLSAPPASSPPHHHLFHKSPGALHLYAWKLSSVSSKREAFCGRLLDLWPVRSDSPLPESYQAKWSVFCGWCELRGCHPLSASVMDLADFIFLWDTKHLSLPSIKGYRSALDPIFQQAGLDISQDRDLSALFQGFAKLASPHSPRIPAWDLSLVLRSLMKSPYEPLRLASLRDVALKFSFLLALASACELVNCMGCQLKFVTRRDFLAKTEPQGDVPQSNFTILALMEYVGDSEEDGLLCPVRAIREYLLTEPQRVVHPHTISHWICQVIQHAHVDVSEEDMCSVRVKAHEVRAVATSALFRKIWSISAVLRAGTWKDNATRSRADKGAKCSNIITLCGRKVQQ